MQSRLAVLLALCSTLFSLAACQTPAPQTTAMGSALRGALLAQTMYPDAGRKPAEEGIDGRAAADAVKLYRNTFKEPPPVTNVINIGGSIGGK